jgi:hypothetical protein
MRLITWEEGKMASTVNVHYEYVNYGAPTLAEGYFEWESNSRKVREKFYFRGLADGRWTLDVSSISFYDVGCWNETCQWHSPRMMGEDEARAVIERRARAWARYQEAYVTGQALTSGTVFWATIPAGDRIAIRCVPTDKGGVYHAVKDVEQYERMPVGEGHSREAAISDLLTQLME